MPSAKWMKYECNCFVCVCVYVIEWLGYTLRKHYHKCNMCVCVLFVSPLVLRLEMLLLLFRCEWFFFCVVFIYKRNECGILKKRRRRTKRKKEDKCRPFLIASRMKTEEEMVVRHEKKNKPCQHFFFEIFFYSFFLLFVCLFDSIFHTHFIYALAINQSIINCTYIHNIDDNNYFG